MQTLLAVVIGTVVAAAHPLCAALSIGSPMNSSDGG